MNPHIKPFQPQMQQGSTVQPLAAGLIFHNMPNLVREALFRGLVFRYLEQAKTERNKLALSSSIIHECNSANEPIFGWEFYEWHSIASRWWPQTKTKPSCWLRHKKLRRSSRISARKTAITARPEFSCPGPNFHNVPWLLCYFGGPKKCWGTAHIALKMSGGEKDSYANSNEV